METPSKKPKLQENKKHIWLITYAASSPNITASMLHEAAVMCDECYSITWRESKYTLIHLNTPDRIRSTALNKAVQQLGQKHGIMGSCIIGYETLSSNTNKEQSVQEHPGFKRMVQALNEGEELDTWLVSGEIKTYRKGLLWKYIKTTDPRSRTRNQLIEQVLEWTPIVQEATGIRSENEALKITLAMRDKELVESQTHNRKLFNDLVDKMDECTALKQRLIKCNVDHTWTKPSV